MSMMVVESQALVRAALRTFLSATPGLTVVAEADALTPAAALAGLHCPDIVLISEHVCDGANALALDALRHEVPNACLVVFTDRPPTEASVTRRIGSGTVDCCLSRESGVRELCAKVSMVLGDRCASCLLRTYCPVAEVIKLSRREREVAVQVAEGSSSKQIAATLGIAVRTVNTYRESIARKLGASSAAVITRFVIEAGLL